MVRWPQRSRGWVGRSPHHEEASAGITTALRQLASRRWQQLKRSSKTWLERSGSKFSRPISASLFLVRIVLRRGTHSQDIVCFIKGIIMACPAWLGTANTALILVPGLNSDTEDGLWVLSVPSCPSVLAMVIRGGSGGHVISWTPCYDRTCSKAHVICLENGSTVSSQC